jgi:hypothetical protein
VKRLCHSVFGVRPWASPPVAWPWGGRAAAAEAQMRQGDLMRLSTRTSSSSQWRCVAVLLIVAAVDPAGAARAQAVATADTSPHPLSPAVVAEQEAQRLRLCELKRERESLDTAPRAVFAVGMAVVVGTLAVFVLAAQSPSFEPSWVWVVPIGLGLGIAGSGEGLLLGNRERHREITREVTTITEERESRWGNLEPRPCPVPDQPSRPRSSDWD